MAFLRVKRFNGRAYYYLVENYREGGKVRQRVLKYLGAEKPPPEVLERLIRELKGE